MKRDDRITETARVIQRLDVLRKLEAHCVSYTEEGITLGDMIGEYQARHNYLDGSKEYMVHFEGGGWNTVYGLDEEVALTKAKSDFEEWKFGKSVCVVKRVTLATEEGIEAACRLFY